MPHPHAHRLTTLLALTLLASRGASAQGRGAPPGPPPVSGIAANGKLGPVVKDGIMQPVLEFADTAQLIKQSLWVETNFDSDHDGKLDRVHVQVTRPGAAEKAGLKIPILMLSSPYIGRPTAIPQTGMSNRNLAHHHRRVRTRSIARSRS